MLDSILGLERSPAQLTFTHMALRGVIVFLAGILFLRLGARRGLARNAGFDVLLSIVLGSVLSRGVNGQASFWPTLGASAVLVGLHQLLGLVGSRVHFVSRLLKGEARVLIKNGSIDLVALRKSLMSHDDLDENLRIHGNTAQVQDVAEARLERSGQISVVMKAKED
jgi:uncharacterized membrane protein YcaP (DUF421 family)